MKIYILQYAKTVCKLCMLLPVLCSANMAASQTPVAHPDRHSVTLISPYYFGPNAFPIPDMLDGTVEHNLRAELSADRFLGKRGDLTADASFRISIPLFTDRVSLSAWMPVMEWWKNSDENIEVCRLADAAKDNSRIRKGHGVGDIFVSTDVELLRETHMLPAVAVRIAFKTASSDDDYCTGRFYDSPGYFFDIAAGKTFFCGDGFFRGLRGAVTTGFLCWQTDNGRQNDATMYGLQAKVLTRFFSISEMFGGYGGWENSISDGGDLAHDRPMSIKSQLTVPVGKAEIFVAHQYGIRDYPFSQLKIGFSWNVDILSLQN